MDPNPNDKTEGVADEVAKGAGGSIANTVLGANMGGGIEGSLAGALTGQAASEDMTSNVPEDEPLAPIDTDSLNAFNPTPDES